ncbi:MAG: PulJ/GspJ family protein [Actinomycetota bacterium]
MTDLIRRLNREEGGLTLIEMMVVIGVFSIITSLAFAVVLNTSNNAKVVRQATDLNEESRLVMNRLSREMRQAARVVAVLNPDFTNADGTERICGVVSSPCFNPATNVGITFQVDFNRDGIIQFTGADPEQITYCYDKANSRLVMQTTSASVPPCIPDAAATVYPILAANVSVFKLTYRSSDYRCDANNNGVVTWQEVETALNPCPDTAGDLVGGVSALDAELNSVDQVVIDLEVLTPPRTQYYRTKIDLRNRH